MATRKELVLEVHLVFEGDYLSADEVAGAAESWIESGLTDRDDLIGHMVVLQDHVVETELKN